MARPDLAVSELSRHESPPEQSVRTADHSLMISRAAPHLCEAFSYYVRSEKHAPKPPIWNQGCYDWTHGGPVAATKFLERMMVKDFDRPPATPEPSNQRPGTKKILSLPQVGVEGIF